MSQALTEIANEQQKVVLEFNFKDSEAFMLNAVNLYKEHRRELKFWLDKLAIQDAYLKTDECVGEKRSRCFEKRDYIFDMMRPYVHAIDSLEQIFNLS